MRLVRRPHKSQGRISHRTGPARIELLKVLCVQFALMAALAVVLTACSQERLPAHDERFWGRLAYVPNWRAGDRIDAIATERFLTRYWATLHPHYSEGGAPGPPGNPVSNSRLVFLTNLDQPILSDYLPTAYERARTEIRITAALGESEAFSLGVRSGFTPTSVQVKLSSLNGPAGRIEAHEITQRLVLTYPARRHARAEPDDRVIKPMVMIKPPSDGWRFPPHTTHNYYLDIHVPLDAVPGHYEGTVAVHFDERLGRKLHLSLEVLPFRLRTNGFHAGAFGIAYKRWAGGFSAYFPSMMEMDSRYGLNMAGAFFNKGNEIPFRTNSDGKLEVDRENPKFARFNQTMQRLKQYGMGDVAFWNWGASGNVEQFNNVLSAAGFPGIDTEAGKLGFAAMCRAIKDAETTYGWPELVINPFDEALDDQDATRELIEATTYVRALSPDTRLYVTEWREHYARLYQSSGKTLKGMGRPRGKEYFALQLSLEAPRANFAVIGSNRAFDDSRSLQNRLGGEYWHYGAAQNVNPWARIVYGLQPYSVRAEAALLWANYRGDLDGSGWTLHFVMPDDRHDSRPDRSHQGLILPSPRALLAREGIDDRKYIETLHYLAAESGNRESLNYLAGLPRRIRAAIRTDYTGGRDNREGAVTTGSLVNDLRAEIASRIASLAAQQTSSQQKQGKAL